MFSFIDKMDILDLHWLFLQVFCRYSIRIHPKKKRMDIYTHKRLWNIHVCLYSKQGRASSPSYARASSCHSREGNFMRMCSPAACVAWFQTGHDPIMGPGLGAGDPCPKSYTPFLLSVENQGRYTFIPFYRATLIETTMSFCHCYYLTRTLTYLFRLCNFALSFADPFYLQLNLSTNSGHCH